MLKISNTKKLGLMLIVALLASIIAVFCYANYSFADVQNNSVGDFQNLAYEKQANITNKDVYENEFYNTETNENYKLLYQLNKDKEATVTGYEGDLPESLIIPNKLGENYPVVAIGRYAFWQCSEIHHLQLPDSITSIGDIAFSRCTNLHDIKLPESLTQIGCGAFECCTSLKFIALPESLNRIDPNAFEGCTKLTTLDILGDKLDARIEDEWCIFTDCVNLHEIHSKYLYINNIKIFQIFGLSINTLVLKDGITSIEDNYFRENTSLESIALPNSLTHIDEGSFANCTNLTSIRLPESLTTIGKGAFTGCSSLKSITIPSFIESIDECAFEGCNNLHKVKFLGHKPQIATNTFIGLEFTLCYYNGYGWNPSETKWGAAKQINYRKFDTQYIEFIDINGIVGQIVGKDGKVLPKNHEVTTGENLAFQLVLSQPWITPIVTCNGVKIEPSSDGFYQINNIKEDLKIEIKVTD